MPILIVFILCFFSGAAFAETTPTLSLGSRFRDPFLGNAERHGPEMVYITPQEFTMGSSPRSPGFKPDEVQHLVRLSAYSIGVYEVTNVEFCEFLNELGNRYDSGIPWVLTDRLESCLIREVDGAFLPVSGAESRPVVTVTWNGANAYCDWLSEKTGASYRLPTEAEWECASRAGTSTIWPWGDHFDSGRLHWRESMPMDNTVAVGSYPPNQWGIHEMLGNAWEFVVDCVDQDFYRHSPTDDPVMYIAQCWTPGIRGGSFADGPDVCRPGHRINTWWWGEYTGVSFRVAREESPSRWYRRRQRARTQSAQEADSP